jgi:hypothetical protein
MYTILYIYIKQPLKDVILIYFYSEMEMLVFEAGNTGNVRIMNYGKAV